MGTKEIHSGSMSNRDHSHEQIHNGSMSQNQLRITRARDGKLILHEYRCVGWYYPIVPWETT